MSRLGTPFSRARAAFAQRTGSCPAVVGLDLHAAGHVLRGKSLPLSEAEHALEVDEDLTTHGERAARVLRSVVN
jgi:hypothetical protein